MATNKHNDPPKIASALAQLRLSAEHKPRKQPAVVERRNKLITRLWEQIQLLKSQESGAEFTVRTWRTVRDVDGIAKRLALPKRIKPWWFTSSTGVLCVVIRYGSSTLELEPGKPVIQAQNPKDLLAILETVKQAVADGELDGHIERASGALKLNFQRIR